MTRPLKTIISIVAAMFMAVTFIGCDSREEIDNESKSDIDKLKTEGLNALNLFSFDKAFIIGDSLLKKAESNPLLTDASIYGNIIKGQASLFNDSIKYSYPCLHEAEALCLKLNNDSALASVYNGLGLYANNIEKDNNEALRYYFLGIDAAKRSDYDRLHSLLLSNVASIYYLSGDPMGLRYALECYNQGKLKKDEYIRYIGAITTAYSYMVRGAHEPALKYIKEAEVVMRSCQINNGATLYCIYGMILRRAGNNDEAAEAFRESIRYMHQANASDFDVRSNIELSEMLVENHRIGHALEVLDSALKLLDEGHNNIFRSDLLAALSRTHRLAGNKAKADEFERIRQVETDSVDNFEKDIAIERIRAKYDLERVENELNRQRVELLEKQKVVYILVSVVAVIIILMVVLIMYFRRKNKLYKAIVTQLTESAHEEIRLRESIKVLEDRIGPDNVVEGQSSLPEETAGGETAADETEPGYNNDIDDDESAGFENLTIPVELYKRLQSEFESILLDKTIYTDNLLNKDKLARRLGTNRTYLSRFVNLHYKMSFPNLINSLRIKEAIRLLSDPTVDTPLKVISEELGYNSQTTFYSKFNEATGMTPAAFRNKARKMSKL